MRKPLAAAALSALLIAGCQTTQASSRDGVTEVRPSREVLEEIGSWTVVRNSFPNGQQECVAGTASPDKKTLLTLKLYRNGYSYRLSSLVPNIAPERKYTVRGVFDGRVSEAEEGTPHNLATVVVSRGGTAGDALLARFLQGQTASFEVTGVGAFGPFTLTDVQPAMKVMHDCAAAIGGL